MNKSLLFLAGMLSLAGSDRVLADAAVEGAFESRARELEQTGNALAHPPAVPAAKRNPFLPREKDLRIQVLDAFEKAYRLGFRMTKGEQVGLSSPRGFLSEGGSYPVELEAEASTEEPLKFEVEIQQVGAEGYVLRCGEILRTISYDGKVRRTSSAGDEAPL